MRRRVAQLRNVRFRIVEADVLSIGHWRIVLDVDGGLLVLVVVLLRGVHAHLRPELGPAVVILGIVELLSVVSELEVSDIGRVYVLLLIKVVGSRRRTRLVVLVVQFVRLLDVAHWLRRRQKQRLMLGFVQDFALGVGDRALVVGLRRGLGHRHYA